MASKSNRQFVLASRPAKGATLGAFEHSDLRLVETGLPAISDGEVLFRNILISVDPYQRNLMGGVPSELPTTEIGAVIEGPTVGIVEESRNPDFAVGDYVGSVSGWREYASIHGAMLRKLDPNMAPVSTALGVLGHTGLTAWIGAAKLMEPKPGGTFVVTNAAGAVGSLAAQIARLRGHRVVGIAGGPDKVAYLRDELGLDAALDYKSAAFAADLKEALPNGIDRLLDSVGAHLFEALLPYFNMSAKLITIGQIGTYGEEALIPRRDFLPDFINIVHYRDVDLKGFQVDQHLHTYPEFLAEVVPLLLNGTLKHREHFLDGFESIPGALSMLYEGQNNGKLIVRVD
jgi:NADPH-dependent curcumin reductase CurA